MGLKLFESIKIGKMELPNRIIRSATWDATANASGAVTDKSVEMYSVLGKGKIGLIISGYMFVSPHGQANPGQYGIYHDDLIPGLKRMTDAVHEGGSKIAVQIMHSGFNSGYLQNRRIIPIAVSYLPNFSYLHAQMTEEIIESIINDFIAGAVRGRVAGFDAVQLHGAHGYLISQFLTPIFNKRMDKWGGNSKNRRKFPLEVIRRVRNALGDEFPFFIKLGVRDYIEGGISLEEGVETARQMVENGLDAIEVSVGIGTGVHATNPKEPEKAYYREESAAVKKVVRVPVAEVGGIRTISLANEIIQSGDADIISISRPFIREPDLLLRWKSGDTTPAKCISCNRCFEPVSKGQPLYCLQEAIAKRGTGEAEVRCEQCLDR
jgi:2,4-dienoyl-CoA reductase-like NADH-dependent reductase (Old Yellow Enzyme family)